MRDQLAFDSVDGYETEHSPGATAATFPVLITPTTAGANVQAPAYVEALSWVDSEDMVVVKMRFPRYG